MSINKIKKISVKTTQLKKKQISDIINLKEQHWKFGIKSQLDYFKNNIKSYDIHNLFFLSNELIGYTALKKRTFFNDKEKKKYLLFDTLILSKKYRNLKISNKIMYFNNKIIRQNKMPSFLICNNSLSNFYKKFFWIKIKTKYLKIHDHKTKKNFMCYNFKIINKNKLIIFFKK